MAGEGFALEIGAAGRHPATAQAEPGRHLQSYIGAGFVLPARQLKRSRQSPAGAFSLKNQHAALGGSATPAWLLRCRVAGAATK